MTYLEARERERARRRTQAAQAEQRHARERQERQRIDSVIAQFEDEDERRILEAYAGGKPLESVLNTTRQVRQRKGLFTLSIDLLDQLVRRFESAYAERYFAAP